LSGGNPLFKIKTWDTGATTDPIIVEGLIKRLKKLSVEIYVIESNATLTNADKAFEQTGIKDICNRYKVGCVNLSSQKEKIKIDIPKGEVLKQIKIPKILVDSAIISAAKLKTHKLTGVTFGLKNMFGVLPNRFKKKYHFYDLDKVIVDINSVVKSNLTVIDGFIGMEGNGPLRGDPVKTDLVVVGVDPVATDSIASSVIGINPRQIRHIRLAHMKGLGRIDKIEVIGSRLEDVKYVFKRC
jgi:uncharacterized protein (DUF362 family)